MKLVKMIKEKRQEINQANDVIIKKIESHVKKISEIINEKVSDSFQNGLNLKLKWMNTEAANKPSFANPRITNPEVIGLYERLVIKQEMETHLGEWFEVDQHCIDMFSQATSDKQWIHVDRERAARESPFRSTIAQGFLLLSLLPKLTDMENYNSKHYPEAKMVVNCGLNNVRFRYPVKTGSSIRSRTRLKDIMLSNRHVELTNEIDIEVNRQDKVACSLELIIRIYI